MFDLSNVKTWTDGFWAVINAPHILGPLLLVVAVVVWWFRGWVEKARRDGLQSIINGRDAQIIALNMQNAVVRERLRLADEAQKYISTKLVDGEKEVTKLKQQIEDKASPEAITATANSAYALLSDLASASAALHGTLKVYEKEGDATVAVPPK
jgi:hypothetical protein